MILSAAYLGNIQYYSKLIRGGTVIDVHENYQKQSYRNRAEIMTAGGVTPLTIPVLIPSGEKISTRDVRIDNSKRWQHRHWNAIASAYGNSPYFFHYGEYLGPFYKKTYNFLLDVNIEIQETILNLLKVETGYTLGSEYMRDIIPEAADFRNCISPKPRLQREDADFKAPLYYQVFSDTVPFAENLSVIDLLMCEGPASSGIIRESYCGL